MIITTDSFFQKCSHKLKTLNKSVDPLKLVAGDSTCLQVFGVVVRLGFVLTSDYLSLFPNLKFIATATTGLDHIDLEYCRKNNIQVLSLKGETDFLNQITATPEHTWALLLSLVRNVASANQSVLRGEWDRESFFGSELANKQIGIIGFGRVGKIISQYALAFRMRVVFYDPHVTVVDSQFVFAKAVTMDELLQSSDIISLHPWLDTSTMHLIGKSEFEKMQKKPILINTSRGQIICENDLLLALQNNWIRAAAMDVLEDENSFVNKKAKGSLLDYHKKNDNLIITPHIAGSTFESMEKTALFIEQKILAKFSEV